MMQVVEGQGPAQHAESVWLWLFGGAVPHAAVYLDVPGHLAMAASCRELYRAWPQVAGLKTLAIFLDRSALSSSTAVAVETPVGKATGAITAVAAVAPNENRDRNHQPPPYQHMPNGGGQGQQQQQQQHRPWNSLSRLLRHWAPFVETLRFSGKIAGAVDDCLKEALGPALSTPIILPPAPAPGSKRMLPTPALPRLKTLALPRVGLFPYHAAALAAFLVGPGGARLEVLDLSYNYALRDEGAVAVFRAVAMATEKAAAAEARAQAAAKAAHGNGQGRVVRRRRASSEPTHQLPALRRLVLSHTELTAVGLRAVFQALRAGAMPNLEALVLSGNPLKIEGGALLAAMVEAGVMPRLQLLDTTACGLAPAEMQRLAEAMGAAKGGLSALHTLALKSNYVDSRGAAALAEAIHVRQLPRLSHLHMDLSGDSPAALLLEALGANDGLRSLHLGKNESLTGETWRRALLSQGTRVPLAGLEELSLMGCRELRHHGPAALVRWAEGFGPSAPPPLRVLNLRLTHPFGPPEEEELGGLGPTLPRLLGCFPRLESLDLAWNRIGREGMARFCKAAVALGSRCRVRELNFDGNALENDGVRALSDALAQGAFPSLRVLVLSKAMGCSSGPIGVMEVGSLLQVLAKRAESGQGLEVLDLSSNNLGGVDALFAGSAMAAWRTLLCSPSGLQSLKLQAVDLDEDAADVLVGLLESSVQEGDAMDVDGAGNGFSSRLTTLDLSNNPIGQAAAFRLLHLACGARHQRRALPRLQTLSLVGLHNIGDAAVVEMAKLLGQESWDWLAHSRLELVDLRGSSGAGREARVQLQGQLSRLRNRLLQEGLCGYTRRLQGLVRVW